MGRPFRVGLISPYSNISAMGLRQISACLKMAGWDTRLIFLPDVGEQLYAPRPHPQDYSPTVKDQVCDLCADVDLVGISVMSNFVGRARALTQAIHDRLSIPVVWGGIHPTVKPHECLIWADFVCVGEGEQAVVELVGRAATGRDCTDIPNIWLKDSRGQIVSNPVRPLNRSLDDLPFPDYELGQQYVLHRGRVVPLTSELLARYLINPFIGESPVVYMTCMTRGCPYECAYCCASALSQIYPDWCRLRRHSPEYIVAEINAARQLVPPIQAIMFLDDTFLATSADEIWRFSEMYREQVGLPFQMMATPGSVTEEKIRYLVEAGLRDIEMGIQTGSRRIRDLFHRPEDNTQVLAAAQCISRFQVSIPRPRYDVISDNPYETFADRLELLRLLYQLPRPFMLHLFSLTFYPGTQLYRRARADGLIQDDDRDVYPKNIVQPAPTYYNFALWCMHRNLPRWLLCLLIQPLLLRVLGSAGMRWLPRVLWWVIYTTRTWQASHRHLRQVSYLALSEGG
jgi:anaerobic magnesium-protoporphyrin IX monomethyl ester cyclase